MRKIRAEIISGTLISKLSYNYDKIDNVVRKQVEEQTNAVTALRTYQEVFTYDDLDRLAAATSGEALYPDRAYQYDPLNNITLKDGRNYEYNSSRPHAVTDVKDSSTSATLYHYEYDQNGHMTQMTGLTKIIIQAKGAGVAQEPPQMELNIGDQTVMEWLVTNTEYQTFRWEGYWDGSSDIEVVYPNDNAAGGEETALYVDYVEINGARIEAEDPNVTYETAGSPPPPSAGLQGYWPLDESGGARADSSGNGNDLTDYNTVGSAPGWTAQAADFERDDDEHLAIADAAQSGLNVTADLTLAGWIWVEKANCNDFAMLAGKYEFGESNNRAYRLGLSCQNRLRFVVSPDGQYLNDYGLDGESFLNEEQWYHVAAVFDATQQTLTLYVDGQPDGSPQPVSFNSIHVSSAPFMLGASLGRGNPAQHFDGRLDDWRVYNRALSQAEIEELTNQVPGSSLPGQEMLPDTGKLIFPAAQGGAPLTRAIAYDNEHRVTSIQDGGSQSYYTYGADRQRLKKTEDGVTTYYFFANYEEVWSGGSQAEARTYYLANGQKIAQRISQGGSETLSYVHADHLGSSVKLTDETGQVIQTIAYDPYGESVLSEGAVEPSYQYTGQEKDAETGLYYYGARYYDAELGRFLQADPFLNGLNRYTYVHNNPIRYIDPSGYTLRNPDEYVDDDDPPPPPSPPSPPPSSPPPTPTPGLPLPPDPPGGSLVYDDDDGDDDEGGKNTIGNDDDDFDGKPGHEMVSLGPLNTYSNSLWETSGSTICELLNPCQDKVIPFLPDGTISFSAGGIGGLIIAGRVNALEIAIDNRGNAGFFSGIGGGGIGAAGANAGVAVSITNAPTVDKLKGFSVQLGGNVGVIETFGGEWILFKDDEGNNYQGGQFGIPGLNVGGNYFPGAEVPLPFSIHFTVEHNWMWGSVNYREVLISFFRCDQSRR